MRYTVTGAIASIALLSAMSLAIAQGRDRDGQPGAGAGPAPSAPAARAPRSEGPATRSQVQQQPRMREQPRVREQSSSVRERAAPDRQLRQRQAEPQRQVRQKQAEPRSDTSKRVQSEERSRQRADQQRQAEQRRQEPRKEQSKTTQGPAGGKDATRQNVNRVQVSDDQRVRVRDRLFKDHRADLNRAERIRGVRPIVGMHIPRRHRLHRLPLWIVDYAPIYRSYSYVLVEDTICIVDPATYVIVDTLPASSQRADVRELNLTPEQMRFVYGEVPKDTPVDVRIRLALGAEIPRNVALYTFPDHVLARLPELERYRYVVVGNDVAIVDPADYAVVLVISG